MDVGVGVEGVELGADDAGLAVAQGEADGRAAVAVEETGGLGVGAVEVDRVQGPLAGYDPVEGLREELARHMGETVAD